MLTTPGHTRGGLAVIKTDSLPSSEFQRKTYSIYQDDKISK